MCTTPNYRFVPNLHSCRADLLGRMLPEQDIRLNLIAFTAPRRRFGLATIVPLDASQPANRTAARVPTARGLLLAGQLTADRTAKLSAGHRG